MSLFFSAAAAVSTARGGCRLVAMRVPVMMRSPFVLALQDFCCATSVDDRGGGTDTSLRVASSSHLVPFIEPCHEDH
jgi:hypothetical protein